MNGQQQDSPANYKKRPQETKGAFHPEGLKNEPPGCSRYVYIYVVYIYIYICIHIHTERETERERERERESARESI